MTLRVTDLPKKKKISLRKTGEKEAIVNSYQGPGNGCNRRFPSRKDMHLGMEAHVINCFRRPLVNQHG